MGEDVPTTLSYSAPRCLFDRGYRHRSWNQVIVGAVLLVFAAFVGWMLGKIPPNPPMPFTAPRVVLWVIAAACVLGVGWLGYKWIRNDVDNARVTEEGIEIGRRVYPWESITTVHGKNVAGGIMAQLDLRREAGAGAFMTILRTRALMTTPFLTRGEFEKLMDDLAAQVVPHHPHVKLDRVPRTSD